MCWMKRRDVITSLCPSAVHLLRRASARDEYRSRSAVPKPVSTCSGRVRRRLSRSCCTRWIDSCLAPSEPHLLTCIAALAGSASSSSGARVKHLSWAHALPSHGLEQQRQTSVIFTRTRVNHAVHSSAGASCPGSCFDSVNRNQVHSLGAIPREIDNLKNNSTPL